MALLIVMNLKKHMQPYIQVSKQTGSLEFYVVTEHDAPLKLNSIVLVAAFREAIKKGYNVNRRIYVDGECSRASSFR